MSYGRNLSHGEYEDVDAGSGPQSPSGFYSEVRDDGLVSKVLCKRCMQRLMLVQEMLYVRVCVCARDTNGVLAFAFASPPPGLVAVPRAIARVPDRNTMTTLRRRMHLSTHPRCGVAGRSGAAVWRQCGRERDGEGRGGRQRERERETERQRERDRERVCVCV